MAKKATVVADQANKVGMFKEITTRVGQGKVSSDELPALFEEARENSEHVTPQLITNVITSFRHVPIVKIFVGDMYECSLKELQTRPMLRRFEELSRVCIICAMFLDESIEKALQKIKKAAGKPYSPGKKTLETMAMLAKGTRCALADAWK